MKKIIALIVALICVLGLVACNQSKDEPTTGDLPPMLTMPCRMLNK